MRSRRLFAIPLVFAALPGCSDASKPKASSSTSSSAAATSTTLPCPARPHAAGQSSESFDFEGQARTYQLYVPPTYGGTRPVPVVFNFHGFGSNAVEQMDYGNFKLLADREDFIVVAVGALLDHLEATFCVNTKRVYSTGMSDGGAMTSALACSNPNRFAAFGAVALVLFLPRCGASPPTAILAFMGTDDPVVPFNGGPVRCCGGASPPAASDSIAQWAAHDGCAIAFNDERLSTEVRKRTWTGCRPGSEVVFYIIDGGGHTWPDSTTDPNLGKTTTQINATATIWDFFKAHPLR